MKKYLLAILLSGIWVTASEFFRNQILFLSLWERHFLSRGLRFETTPLNGMLWMLWSFFVATLVVAVRSRFSFWATVVLVWIPSFVMMWMVIYNLQVLPLSLLVAAIPLSIVEVVVATVIAQRIIRPGRAFSASTNQ